MLYSSARMPEARRSAEEGGRLVDEGDDPRGRRVRAHDLERKAGGLEAGRRQRAEIEEALDLRVREAGLMSRPEDSRLVAFDGFLSLEVKRAVPAPGVDAHDANAAVVEPVG